MCQYMDCLYVINTIASIQGKTGAGPSALHHLLSSQWKQLANGTEGKPYSFSCPEYVTDKKTLTKNTSNKVCPL